MCGWKWNEVVGFWNVGMFCVGDEWCYVGGGGDCGGCVGVLGYYVG